MSVSVENTHEDLEILVGATILSAEGTPGSDDPIVLNVRFVAHLDVNGSNRGRFEIWQDGEGNGPGYIAYLGP